MNDNADETGSIALAAQADLILLTVDMLRAPQADAAGGGPPWSTLPTTLLHGLLNLAFGSTAAAREKGAPSLLEALDDARQLAQSLDHEEWNLEYWRLFGGSQVCAMNQASYIRRDKGAILGDLCGFYEAFGFRRNLDSGERPDHLSCQLEFMAMLLAMAARADQDEHRAAVHDALAKFARAHVNDWLPSVCCQLVETTHLAYFASVAQWLLLLMQTLIETHSWPVDPILESLAPESDPDNPYECAAPDLVQLGGLSAPGA